MATKTVETPDSLSRFENPSEQEVLELINSGFQKSTEIAEKLNTSPQSIRRRLVYLNTVGEIECVKQTQNRAKIWTTTTVNQDNTTEFSFLTEEQKEFLQTGDCGDRSPPVLLNAIGDTIVTESHNIPLSGQWNQNEIGLIANILNVQMDTIVNWTPETICSNLNKVAEEYTNTFEKILPVTDGNVNQAMEEMRNNLGLTQSTVEQNTSNPTVTQYYLSRYENGHTELSQDKFDSLMEFYHTEYMNQTSNTVDVIEEVQESAKNIAYTKN